MSFVEKIYLNIKLSFLRGSQQMLILPYYFKYPLFSCDWRYFLAYAAKNPYRICQKFFQNQGINEVFYGDTWPFAAAQLVKHLKIDEKDFLYDLGCGTGRISFWFQLISNCRVKAIDLVPAFIKQSEKIRLKLKNERIEFIQGDFLNMNYSEATIIYFYGLCETKEVISKLVTCFTQLKKGARIITTGFSLKDYNSKCFKVLAEYKVSYPWGLCQVFVQQKCL